MKEPEDKRQMLPKESCKEESLYPCASMFMPSFKETPLPHGTSPHFKPVTLTKVSATQVNFITDYYNYIFFHDMHSLVRE